MAGGHLHSQSFLLSSGGTVTHVRQVTHGYVRTTELVLEKNEQKKKKVEKTVKLRRYGERTQ